MKVFLAILILFSCLSGYVSGDDNIYGPGNVNLGPDGDPGRLMQELERQRRQEELLMQRQSQLRRDQAVLDNVDSAYGLTLRPQYNGHYFVTGAINDTPLVFTIDTGASYVTLPEEIASQAGISCENEAIMETANGNVKACTGIIEKLEFGDFSITNVRCIIAPVLNYALLGNNVLKQFKILQHDGELRIFK